MTCTHRAGLLILAVALLAAVTLSDTGRGDQPPAPVFQPFPVNPTAPPEGTPAPVDLVTLPTDRTVQRRLDAARDYIKTQTWSDAVRLL